MISSQVIATSIEELRAITRIELCVYDPDGTTVASTFDNKEIEADSQVIGTDHLLKITDEGELAFVLVARGSSDDTYVIGRIAASQIQQLMAAYKERFDRNNFFQNLLLDNLLLVDIYNRAKKLHIEVTAPRVVLIVETEKERDSTAAEFLGGLFSAQSGDFITAIDESSVILIKSLASGEGYEAVEQTADMIVDMMNTEAMMNVRVAYGTIVQELKDVSKSYKEANLALDVGKIFYVEKKVNAYSSLGIGRLIYQLPVNLGRIFID